MDIKQNYDDDDVGFDMSDMNIGDDVMVESDLDGEYSIEETDSDEDADFDPDDSDIFSGEDLFAGLSDLDD